MGVPSRLHDEAEESALTPEFSTELIDAYVHLFREVEPPAGAYSVVEFRELWFQAAVKVALGYGADKDRLIEIIEGYEYRPLPPFGTAEFEVEIERRRANPGRPISIDEAIASLRQRTK